MIEKDFNNLVDGVCEELKSTLKTKADQYAHTDDRLANFKAISHLLGVSYKEALWGLVVKHIVALNDFIVYGLDPGTDQWLEKTGDIICYMILLRGILIDGGEL